MEKLIIINASPRAPKSNSKRYSEIFMQKCRRTTEYYALKHDNHKMICSEIEHCSDILFVFPLYADSLPVSLIKFLKSLIKYPPKNKPVISIMINCGFLEPRQNCIAEKQMRLFAEQNGYKFGAAMKIGSGEAILDTIFAPIANMYIHFFAASMAKQRYRNMSFTMPVTKKTFLKESTKYWLEMAKKNNITEEDMRKMKIED